MRLFEYFNSDKVNDKGSTDLEVPRFRNKSTWTPAAGRDTFLDSFLEAVQREVDAFQPPKYIKDNLTLEEREALTILRTDDNIVIKPEDKGPAFVIQNKSDYIHTAKTDLSNVNFYRENTVDKTTETAERVNKVVRKMLREGDIEGKTAEYLVTNDVRTSKETCVIEKRPFMTMGNETSGFAVLNLSSYTVHFGLSMAATHYHENNVKHGEIFYRWPGAVHYTVSARAAPQFSEGTGSKTTTKEGLLEVTCVGAAVTAVILLPGKPAHEDTAASLVTWEKGGAIGSEVGTATSAEGSNYAIVKQVLDALAHVPASDLSTKKMGCYGGGSGTWLVLRGGVQHVNREVTHEKLHLEKVKPEYIFEHGKFTELSYKKFYTSEKAHNYTAAGHSCSKAKCKLFS
ncbi:hypothetical protein HOLleu_02116 [Holothuria leucospilota]|uniref:Uncharacterized protein n=1 Tax=Holothuria leucospilota TaxID=206669 RepID=A0A9Q1CRB2_HOLLE|nr:hypothetical protein HOLleu_02116 [Holothuria leucospilota]